MLRLWPDTIYIGLFPGCCWLQRGINKPAKLYPMSHAIDPAALLQNLDVILNEQVPPIAKGSRLKITISDCIGSTAVLPWQSELSRREEIDGYARICFERVGAIIGQEWVMHAEFRQFGGMGIAYALPQEWLDALLSLTQKSKLKLVSILPLTAAAYCKQNFKMKGDSTLLLLLEANQHSAMVFNKEGFAGYDVEPFSRSLEETRNRLIRRVATSFANISRVSCWSVDGKNIEMPADSLANFLPHVESVPLKHQAWN